MRLLRLALPVFTCIPAAVSGEKIKLNLNLNEGSGGLGGLGDLLSGLAGAAKQKQDGTCPSVCDGHPHEDTYMPAPKPRIRPYSNGCSVPASMRDSLGDYSVFEGCCDLHDACYMACGVPKPVCEQQFQQCMQQACNAKFSNDSISKSSRQVATKKGQKSELQACHSMASVFATGTSMFGCGGYHDLQNHGCDCLPPEKAHLRMVVYAHELWATYNATNPNLPEIVVEKFLDHPEDRPKQKREQLHGSLLSKLYQKYPEVIEKISSDGQSSRDQHSVFEVASN